MAYSEVVVKRVSIEQYSNPFDAIRCVDEDGENWSARDLMPLSGYSKWERFEDAIDRAKASCRNSGEDVDLHFSRRREDGRSSSSGYARDDYRLTRYAAYLIAMNGDPRKPEIAAAQTYFVIKTREAELGMIPAPRTVAIPQSFAEALELAAQQQREIEAAQAQLAIAAPKVEFHDRFMESGGLTTMTDLGDMFGVDVRVTTKWLLDLGIFRKNEYAQYPTRRTPKKQYVDRGLFEVKIEKNGYGHAHPVAYATPAGVAFVQEEFRKSGLAD